MTPAQWIDLALVLFVVAGAWGGWRRGVVAGTVELVSLALGFVAALALYPHGLRWLEQEGWTWGVWTAPAVFFGIFVLVRIVFGIGAGLALRALPARAHTHALARTLGVVPGAASGLLNAVIAAAVVLAVPADNAFTRAVAGSSLARTLAEPADWLEARLEPVFAPAVEKTLSRLTVQPESKTSIALPFRVAAARERPDLEARMLDLVNDERRREGLHALTADPEATVVARDHARDMLARGYFSHVTPDGLDPGDRARRGRLAFRITGENLALARNLPMAHQGLMDSPGHRANILRPAYGRVGIGIVDAGRHGIVATQVFRN